ncbi:MAG: hypothetical protein WCW63_04370 [Acholeplasmataceae bacterium]|jgi:hypothetical protein
MMRDERVYHEYANWKIENHELLKYLIESNSDLILRFKHVLDVTDYLYDRLIDDHNYTDEEDQIFETGFYYVLDQLDQISRLLKDNYQNDIKDLEKRAKDVNLLLAAIDFQNELVSLESYEQKDLESLIKFEEELLKILQNKHEVPKDMYQKLDDITFEMFQRLDVEYFPIDDIFLEIADELGIL